MSETKERMAEIKEKLVKTENGAELTMQDPETGKSAVVAFSAADMTKMMVQMAAELRKPDDETLRIREEEKARKQESMRQMIILANAETDAKNQRWANCNHKKERGESAWQGQVFSDGNYRAICLHCQMISAPQKITASMMAGMGF